MRVVIDTNSLETTELSFFLGCSSEHAAVVPSHSAAEIFRPNSNEAIFSAFGTLCSFPKQVIVLKENRIANRVDPSSPAISNHFIDKTATRKFPEFCNILHDTTDGDGSYLNQIALRRRWAIERIENMRQSFGNLEEELAELGSNFTDNELYQLRSGNRLLNLTKQKILAITTSLAGQMYGEQFRGRRLFPPPYRYNHFVWRYTLAHIVRLMCHLKSGAKRRASKKAANDHFDNVFATFGTYFNGVMSNDREMLATQHIMRTILSSLSVRLAPDYISSGYIEKLIERHRKDPLRDVT